jgi:hypothetical protein
MDPSQFDHANWVILGSIVGFLVLAFILLYPVHRFLNREEETSRSWTQDEIARRQQRRGDGSATGQPELPRRPAHKKPEDDTP